MGVWCVCGVGVRRGVAWGVRSQVVGMATSRGAREETGARTRRVRAFSAHASGAGDAVNGKYENKENRDCRRATIPGGSRRHHLGSADDMYEALNQDSRFKI